MPTQKQLLELIHAQTQTNAQNQLDFAGKVSAFMNEQESTNQKLRSYLESDKSTNQKGIVEQVHDNTVAIEGFKTDKKVTAGKITMAGLIFTFIGGIVLKILGFIKFTG